MFKNFIVLAYRHFIRSPLSSFIELFGMTAGLTVFLLILLWVFHENSIDKFNEKSDWVHRLEWSDVSEKNALCSSIVAPLIHESLPEVEKFARFRPSNISHSTISLVEEQGREDIFDAGRNIYADNEIFDIFSFDFIAGNPETALSEKNTVVITESLAKTVFGDDTAIGQQIISPQSEWYAPKDQKFIITGVIKDMPTFHIPFKMLKSLVSLKRDDMSSIGEYSGRWGQLESPTYLLINPKQDIASLEKKITNYVRSKRPEYHEKDRPNITYHLRPLKDIYFEGSTVKEMGYAIHGDTKKVLAYTSIAFFTLLLACINFINLNSAKSFERAKEVGIKKVSGASRANVFAHFLGEVAVLCFVSLILALIFTHSTLPYFNQLMDTSLSMQLLINPVVFASMVIGLLLISLVSGGFPALYMSSFQPVASVKGLPTNNGQNFSFKKINLLIQFAVTTILLIVTITIYRQIGFMKYAELGFSKEHRISFDFRGNKKKTDVMKQALLLNPNVLSASFTSAIPGMNTVADQEFGEFKYKGVSYPQGWAIVDEDYVETLGLEMVAGRFYEKNRPSDRILKIEEGTIPSMVLNESAIKLMGIENPIGTILDHSRGKAKVIGIIKDFHLNSLDHPILPMHFVNVNYGNKMVVNITSSNMASTIEYIRTEVEKKSAQPANIKFIDQEFDRQYQREENFAELVSYFATLAILIAAMGLLGIATHTIKLRIKEVGIRKIMGASIFQILSLLMGSFVKIVILSSLLAVPIAWFAMQKWLDNYPYRTDLPWWVFAVACGLTVFVASFTIIWQSWRASSVNPARLIRYE
ncbi:MAG: FtsX-like permease family protein [Cyclobacteriaceae bacterium]